MKKKAAALSPAEDFRRVLARLEVLHGFPIGGLALNPKTGWQVIGGSGKFEPLKKKKRSVVNDPPGSPLTT